MHRLCWKTLAIALFMSSVAYGQSLGDIARENREKQNAEAASPTTTPKVITNKDLPKDPNPNPGPSATPLGTSEDISKGAENRAEDRHFADQRLAEQHAADQWKRQIRAQKNKAARLQARIDQLHASIHAANGSVQFEGPVNRYQALQLQQVAQFQQQLNEHRRKLEQMQEAARHAGMRTPVYDP
jgi:hypothetical protein